MQSFGGSQQPEQLEGSGKFQKTGGAERQIGLPEITSSQQKIAQQSSNQRKNELRDSYASQGHASNRKIETGLPQNIGKSGGQQKQLFPQISQQLSVIQRFSQAIQPRKDPGYDYVSLGSRIQDQIKGVNGGAGKYQRQPKNLSMQPPASRRSQGGRTVQQTPTNMLNQTLGNSNGGIKAMLQGISGPQSASQTPSASNFENYLKKVIKSVERRKGKNFPQENTNQTQRLGQLMELDYQPDLRVQNKNSSYGILALTQNNHGAGSLQTFQNSIIGQNKQENSQKQLQQRLEQKPSTLRDQQLAIVEESGYVDETQTYITGQGKIAAILDNTDLRSEAANSSKRGSKRGSHQREPIQASSHPYQLARNQFHCFLVNLVLQNGKKKAEHNATEQVVQLLKETQKKDKIFIPLEKSTDVSSGYMFQEMRNPPENHAGIVVFSKQGFVTVGKERNATSNFVSNDEYITNGVNKFILSEIPFFKKFQMMRLFKQWKYIMRWNFYQRKREKLAETFFFAKPIFSEKYNKIINEVNTIRTLPFMEIKKNVTYGKKQQSMLDERCKSKLEESKERLEKLLTSIKAAIVNLKIEIQQDDKSFENSIKEMKVQAMIKQKRHGEELVMFSKARKQKEIEEEQKHIQRIRHIMYDKFVEFILKFVCGNLVELLYENKLKFKDIFKDLKSGPQFEASVCFNQKGRLDTDPSMEDHYASFLLVFENMERAVYQNQSLIEFISDIIAQLYREKKVYYKNIFNSMEQILRENKSHALNNDSIFESLKKDITKCREYLEQFVPLQEIYDFAKDWETNKKDQQLSSEMGFYKETWLQMDRYNSMIDKIPAGNTKLGTILVETLSLKKYLHELPKRVIDSIRHNVTLTMETETKSLREELSKTSEILDQLPTSLNVYVEQVNTLKYVKEKQEDFSQKFQTINKLHQLCKQDNIKVSLTLQLAIDEVSHLYESLPKLQRTAAEGLSQNKDTMEKIMQSSSLVLSKKIKAFEKKYVETYLQDKSRLEDCADTLEELFKRSKAIHEIRSKVILYKEFLKLLYEDDPDAEQKLKKNKLQCADDYEFVQSIHKETIKLWKMLLYWRKRRQMCYNSPFLQLDTNKIIRSINKINKYFEDKLSKNLFLREKSRPLCKVVILQVKETSLIIEFLKDLRKESLQQRHWLQIFNLIKAPHLKNSNSFTIVNLKEYHIQNYREEIAVIIEHANTELKYERIFRSIKEEWEALELKIIPYKETMDSYILINTDTLSNAIEENLTTLETISQSKYAEHVRQDISDWMKTLKVMLKNLEVWIVAQKHWINLDPIFQSAQLEDILGQDTTEFQEYRNQFKRIMWSAFKNPKATYNLMISNRIEVFDNLIKYFSVLQKKVQDYLEQRRLAFPRFFFLSDSQFLDFLTLSNSNQDFNDYVSILFQGAKSLYINRLLNNGKTSASIEDPQIDNLLRIGEDMNDSKLKSISDRNSTQQRDQDILDQDVPTPYMRKAFKDKDDDKTTIQVETISHEDISVRDREDLYTANSEANIKHRPENSGMTNDFGGVRLGQVEKEKDQAPGFQVLGMIGHSKELFLFERAVPMKDGVEQWLLKVEEAMQETVAKQINYAVSSFPKQSLDEWILDYPQQVILSTIHLILSHEINELLEEMGDTSKNEGAEDQDNQSDKNGDEDDDAGEQTSRTNKTGGDNTRRNRGESRAEADEDISIGKSTRSRQKRGKRNNLSSAGHGTFSKKSSQRNIDDDDDSAMKDYIKKKQELKAQQKAEEEMEKRRLEEEQRMKIEANEPPRNPEKEKRKFVDEMFGRDFPADHYQLQDRSQQEKSESDPLVPRKPPSFKETVMTLLQRKSFQGLFLRLQFWIQQIIKSLYPFKYGQLEKFNMEIQLHSVQKMVMMTIISFLIFQREIVENLTKKSVTSQNDFEWQSQVRLLWTGVEPGCRVDCGGWSTYQQNEYLGSTNRLIITPLTNRYFIFMSAALREKSAVMFKCSPSEQKAGDIFEEFSNICSVPYKRIKCNPIIQMKTMMQFLNGSALASVWIFFEHIDKLPFSHFQALNKEIQMVQQQFIIAELSGNEQHNASLSKASNSQVRDKNMMIRENSNNLNGASSVTNKKIVSQLSSMPQSSSVTAINQRSNYEKSQLDQTTPKSQVDGTVPFTKAAKICFGVFGSISHNFIINHSDIAQQLLNHSQSAFRVVALTRPSELQIMRILFKQHGFEFYEQLAQKAFACIESFYEQKQEIEKKIEANDSLQIHENLTLDDMKLISKMALQFRRFDYWAYLIELKQRAKENAQREVLSLKFQKTREDKIKDLEKLEAQIDEEKGVRYKVELNSVKSTLHLYLMKKFQRSWIAMYELIYKYSGFKQNQLQTNFETVIQKCLDQAFKNEEEEAMMSSLTEEQRSLIQLANIKKFDVTNSDLLTRYQLCNGSLQLIYNKVQEGQDQRYYDKINNALKVVVEKLNYDKVYNQIRNCIQFIDFLGRKRAIALIGPTCTGKTSILKLVSNVVNLAFNVKMRTSVINSPTYTQDELYGTTDAFSSQSKGSQASNAFNKQGIFQIILDVFEKERNQLSDDEKKSLVQSIFLDSENMDSVLTESLMDFISQANKKENIKHNINLRKNLDMDRVNEIVAEELEECIPVTLPNQNVIMIPQSLYIFFEATTLKDSSPSFVSRIGLIITEEEELSWKNLMMRHKNLCIKRHSQFCKERNLNFKQHFEDCWRDFLEPFLEAFLGSPKVQGNSLFRVKASVLQFFNLLNSMIYRVNEISLEKGDTDDPGAYMLNECQRDVFWSSILVSLIWSFGGPVNRECRKVFEENFFNYRRKFNINISGPGKQRFTLFDIYYDPENLQWDLLQEKLEYKLKLHYDAQYNTLMIPTVEVSQSYFLMDIILGSLKHDESLDKHFRVLGPSGTSKSTALHTFIKKYSDQYNSILIPVSCYLTLDKFKTQVESFYHPKRRNQLEPLDKNKKLIFIIDDLHLLSNLKINILEFLRTWCVSKGYYDIKQGFFKNIGEFGTIMAENSDYRNNYCKVEGKNPTQSRFLFYANTLYIDEYDFDRYKLFIQHWLTSKMWSTSKIINKYYILMTNTIMTLMDKLKRQEYFHNSTFLRLTNFHIFSKFCSNLANYTLISDETKEIVVKGQKEEDAASNMMLYELMRSVGDRIMLPNYRNNFILRMIDACKQEFITGNYLNPKYCDEMLLGNYHNRRPGAHIKYLYMNNDFNAVRQEIREKIRKCSNNHFLETFLDAPNGPKEIFRLSRILFKEMQHLILLGHAGSGMHEYLQLATILNDGLIFELNVAKFGEPMKFAQIFKQAILSSVQLNSFSFFIINDQQIRDCSYIDYTYNFINNIIKNENCILMDQEFKQQLIDIEKDLANQNQGRKMVESNNEVLFLQALRKIQKNVHIVFMISDHSTYYEWVSLFPALEHKCEVIYMDELSSEGYRQLTAEFFNERDTDNSVLNNQNLIKALVEARQITKHKILGLFYSQSMLQYTANEEFVTTQQGEYVFNSDKKLHGFLYENGVNSIIDPAHKQLNYNVPVQISYIYKARYVMFLELFRFLYDFLSMNLVIRRNYYETFLRKASEFQDFFKDIKSTKSVLHNESNQITYKLATLKDKIQNIHKLIFEKDQTISRRLKDIADLEIELKNNRDELNSVVFEKDKNIDDILGHLEKINGSEFSYIINTTHYKPNERALLDLFAMVIEKDQRVNQYDKKQFDMYFLNREELINLLNDRRNYEYDDKCFNRLKDFINQYAVNDFKDRPLMKQLFNFLMELYRKLNVRNTMSGAITRIKEIKEQIDSSHFSINYSRQFIEDKKEEMEGLKGKFERIKDQEQSLSKRIEEAEISHMRTEHIFMQVEKYTNKIYSKLTEVKRRIEHLLGDCIIMASSVVFLGVLSLKERLQARKEIFDYVVNGCNIQCSQCWNEVNPALNNQSQLFKQVIKEYGLRKVIQNHNYSGIISQPVVVEALFSMIFAPSCPYIVDPTGQLEEFIESKVLQNLKIKQIYGSDRSINSQLEAILRSQTFALLNDTNDMSKDTFGLCHDQPLIHRLCTTTHNGFDFDYDRLTKLKQLHALQAYHNSYQSVNKRISTNTPEYENLSFYQVQIFTPRFDFNLNREYHSKATVYLAMNNDAEVIRGDLATAPWVEIKELMLKHFLPESYKQLQQIQQKLKELELKKSELNKNFENLFLVANQDTLQNILDYSELKQSVEDIRYSQEERRSYQKNLQDLLNENSLLNSYSNVLTIMYIGLKKLSKISGEITYSWKMYLTIIDQILLKIVRDLNTEQLQLNKKKNEQSTGSISVTLHGHAGQRSKNQMNPAQMISSGKDILEQKEFTIDEDFFSTIIIPAIYQVIISSVKQAQVSMYNLLLSILIALKKKEITEAESEFFFKNLFAIKDFHLWRNSEKNFVDLDTKIEKSKFYAFKREILKIYPDIARKVMEQIEKDCGQTFSYKLASLTIYGKIFTQLSDFKNLTLMQKINIGFLCPDHEFTSKICQLVYEQLSSIFSFSEEMVKLHHFIKTASWQQPIALLSQNQINIINTVCSIASYYGVGLEVLRSDNQMSNQQSEKGQNFTQDRYVIDNLQDYSKIADKTVDQYRQRLNKEAATYYGSNKRSTQIYDTKINYDQIVEKDCLGIDDKQLCNNQTQELNPLKMIENCAIQGSWVFISTLKFPSYWLKMCNMLDNLKQQNKIQNSFRVFVDLQGYSQNEIPDSFLFNHSISFYLTEQNNEDMEGFNDMWANILNDKILTELTKQDGNLPVQEEKKDDDPFEDQENANIDQSEALQLLNQVTQDQLIKNEQHRDQYLGFLKNQMLEDSKNDSNTLIFGSEPTIEIKKQDSPMSNMNRERNLNELLSDVKSIGSQSQDLTGKIKNQNEEKSPYQDQDIIPDQSSQLDQDQAEKTNIEEESKFNDNKEQPLVSRINSAQNSMDLSKGENLLIQELQNQFEESKKIQRTSGILNEKQKSISNEQPTQIKEKIPNAQQNQMALMNEINLEGIDDREADQAFDEFNNDAVVADISDIQKQNLNDTSDLL